MSDIAAAHISEDDTVQVNTGNSFDRRAFRMTAYPLAVVALILVGVVVVVMSMPVSQPGRHPIGGDFPAFYLAGEAVLDAQPVNAMYDTDTQKATQVEFAGPEMTYLPFAYPPQVAVAYAPLALLPYRLAYSVDVVLMVAALAAALWLIRPMVPVLQRRFPLVLALALVFIPMLFSVQAGQNVTVSILLLAWLWRALNDGMEMEAGAAVALLMFKPQYAVPLVGLLLLGRYYRAVAVAVAGVAATAVLNTVVFGTAWVSVWLGQARSFASGDGPERAPYLVNPVGFLKAVLGDYSTVALVAGAAVGVGVGVVLVSLWRSQTVPLDLLMAVTAAGLILMSPHSAFYDANLALLTVIVLVDRGLLRPWFVAGLVVAGLTQFVNLKIGFSPFALVVFALFVAAVSETVAHTEGATRGLRQTALVGHETRSG